MSVLGLVFQDVQILNLVINLLLLYDKGTVNTIQKHIADKRRK